MTASFLFSLSLEAPLSPKSPFAQNGYSYLKINLLFGGHKFQQNFTERIKNKSNGDFDFFYSCCDMQNLRDRAGRLD